MEVIVARQAIFDRERSLYGYELLFRSDASANQFDGTEAAAATMQVLSNTLMAIGGEPLLAGKKAFVNFDHDLLRTRIHLALPRESLVIEILETVEHSPELVTLCQSIRQQGYALALDDFADEPRLEPLTHVASVIKVDLRRSTREEQERMIRKYQPRGIRMLAEKVESYSEFQWARHAGYDLFQGYFFARPVVIRRRQIPAQAIVCLRLLREAQQPDLDFTRLEELIREDVSLTYKLLRYANTAKFPRRDTTESIAEAMMTLGEEEIRRWVVLATLPMLATHKPVELVTLAMVRARFGERLSELTGIGRPDQGFLMGMFSLLDALVDQPLDNVLPGLALAEPVTRALLGTAPDGDPLTSMYDLILCYEQGDWDRVEQLSRRCRVDAASVGKAYLDSTVWAAAERRR